MKKILIVDDDRLNLELCRARLIEYDLTLETVPQRALYLMNQNIYDLVITNLDMPNMTGFELLRLSRNMGSSVKIILMATFENIKSMIGLIDAPNGIEGVAREIGFNSYLAKPHKTDEIRNLVKRTIG